MSRCRRGSGVTEQVALERQAEDKQADVHADSDAASISASLRKCVVDDTYSPELSSELPRLVEKLLVEEENEEEEEEEEKGDMVVTGSVEEKVG